MKTVQEKLIHGIKETSKGSGNWFFKFKINLYYIYFENCGRQYFFPFIIFTFTHTCIYWAITPPHPCIKKRFLKKLLSWIPLKKIWSAHLIKQFQCLVNPARGELPQWPPLQMLQVKGPGSYVPVRQNPGSGKQILKCVPQVNPVMKSKHKLVVVVHAHSCCYWATEAGGWLEPGVQGQPRKR
jgi:hypothetical protein